MSTTLTISYKQFDHLVNLMDNDGDGAVVQSEFLENFGKAVNYEHISSSYYLMPDFTQENSSENLDFLACNYLLEAQNYDRPSWESFNSWVQFFATNSTEEQLKIDDNGDIINENLDPIAISEDSVTHVIQPGDDNARALKQFESIVKYYLDNASSVKSGYADYSSHDFQGPTFQMMIPEDKENDVIPGLYLYDLGATFNHNRTWTLFHEGINGPIYNFNISKDGTYNGFLEEVGGGDAKIQRISGRSENAQQFYKRWMVFLTGKK